MVDGLFVWLFGCLVGLPVVCRWLVDGLFVWLFVFFCWLVGWLLWVLGGFVVGVGCVRCVGSLWVVVSELLSLQLSVVLVVFAGVVDNFVVIAVVVVVAACARLRV